MAVSLSVQGAIKAAMDGGMSQCDLEKLVGDVIQGVYEGDNDCGEESASPPPMPTLPSPLAATLTVPLFAVAKVYGTVVPQIYLHAVSWPMDVNISGM